MRGDGTIAEDGGRARGGVMLLSGGAVLVFRVVWPGDTGLGGITIAHWRKLRGPALVLDAFKPRGPGERGLGGGQCRQHDHCEQSQREAACEGCSFHQSPIMNQESWASSKDSGFEARDLKVPCLTFKVLSLLF